MSIKPANFVGHSSLLVDATTVLAVRHLASLKYLYLRTFGGAKELHITAELPEMLGDVVVKISGLIRHFGGRTA